MLKHLVITVFIGSSFVLCHTASADTEPPRQDAQQFVTLKPGARVDAAYVVLGDLFDNAGDHANDKVAAAPLPGSAVVYTTNWLEAISVSHGLSWQPPSAYASIRVERAAVTVDSDQIAVAIGKSLDIDGVSDRVVLDSPIRLYAPTDAPADIGIEHLSLNRETSHFLADIRVPANSDSATPVHISGTVQKFIQVPVAQRGILPGDVIGAGDVALVWLRAEFNSSSAVPALADLVGKTPRHPLRANGPIKLADVETPIIVKRNDLVLIVMESPGMVLTAEGKAIQDGGLGETIRVTNTQSDRTIDATVVASGRVSVRPPMSLAYAY